jgi:hypothetical protein
VKRKSFLTIVLIAVSVLLTVALSGCRREKAGDAEHTGTMAPVTPPPTATASDTDAPATQTMEIGDDRSSNEGGALATEERSSTATTATTTHAPAPKKKK